MEAKPFFDEVIQREDAIKELKEELKAMLDAFASSNDMTTKGIQKGIKEYKEFIKNRSLFTVTDGDADKIFEALAG